MSDRPSFAPYLVVSNATAAIDFYKKAFGAQELARHQAPGTDKIMHAHLVLNGGHVMLSDDFAAMHGTKSETPEALGGSPVTFNLQVDDANAAWDRAVNAGASVAMPLADQFWGDRYGIVHDPFGHKWSICQHIHTPSPEELEEAAKAAMPA